VAHELDNDPPPGFDNEPAFGLDNEPPLGYDNEPPSGFDNEPTDVSHKSGVDVSHKSGIANNALAAATSAAPQGASGRATAATQQVASMHARGALLRAPVRACGTPQGDTTAMCSPRVMFSPGFRMGSAGPYATYQHTDNGRAASQEAGAQAPAPINGAPVSALALCELQGHSHSVKAAAPDVSMCITRCVDASAPQGAHSAPQGAAASISSLMGVGAAAPQGAAPQGAAPQGATDHKITNIAQAIPTVYCAVPCCPCTTKTVTSIDSTQAAPSVNDAESQVIANHVIARPKVKATAPPTSTA